MDENMEIKGLSARKKLALAIAGGVVALIILVYLGLCVYVGASRTVLPGVWTRWAELSGMTQEEASSALDTWVEQVYADARYDLTCGDSTVTLSGDLVRLDSGKAAEEAYLVGRSEPFLKRGAVIFAHFLGVKTMLDCPMELSDAGTVQLKRALEQLGKTENIPLVETVWSVAGEELVITRGVTGVSVDEQQAQVALLDALQHPGAGTVEVPVVRTEPAPLELKRVHDEIYAQAVDAYVERDEQGNVQVVPHVVGIDFDPVSAQERFDVLEEGKTVRIPLSVTVPNKTQAQVRGQLFADILGQCETNIGGTEYRLNNVKVAAKAMDGVILLPGEVFSYNNTLGPRTIANGYLPAPAYIGGKTVDDVGGGICQNSSTLYLAVLRANLQIVERTNHMYTVGYVPDGLDATVAYNAIDFKFRNSTDYPIRVEARVDGRRMIVKLHGTDTEHVTVKMVTETLSTTPYTVTYKPDSTVAAGKTVVDTTAYTGKKVQVFRCVYDQQGNLISKTKESTNNYRHRDKVILYNPADAKRLGLVDANGKVHTTVQPQPKPEPAPEPTPAPAPVQPDTPVVAPETEQTPDQPVQENTVPEQQGQVTLDETTVVAPESSPENVEGV